MTFDDIVLEHIGWIARQSLRFCRSRADAEDLAQDTLLRLYDHRDSYNRSRPFKPWALTIMANIFKSAEAHRRLLRIESVEDVEEPSVPCDATERAVVHDLLSAIRKAARMAVGVRCVLLYAKGYTYSEIAESVGIMAGTVKSRVASGRCVLRRLVR